MKRVQLETLYITLCRDGKEMELDAFALLLDVTHSMSDDKLRHVINSPNNWPGLNTFHEGTIKSAFAVMPQEKVA